MSYAQQPPQHAPNNGRETTAYRTAARTVRARAEAGEPCWFWQRDPNCPGPGWNWQLPPGHRWAYTTHHLHRLMDGGEPAPDPNHMAPAHRGCNSRDGLQAQNARRAGLPTATSLTIRDAPEITSRAW